MCVHIYIQIKIDVFICKNTGTYVCLPDTHLRDKVGENIDVICICFSCFTYFKVYSVAELLG